MRRQSSGIWKWALRHEEITLFETAGFTHRWRALQGVYDHRAGFITDGSGPGAFALLRALIFAHHEFTRPHLDALAIHRLDEPPAGEDRDPLRFGIFVPFADPSHRQNREGHTRSRRIHLVAPLRLDLRIDSFQFKSGQLESLLTADAVLIHVDVPVTHPRLRLMIRHVVSLSWVAAPSLNPLSADRRPATWSLRR